MNTANKLFSLGSNYVITALCSPYETTRTVISLYYSSWPTLYSILMQQRKDIPVQPGVLMLPVHYFHLYQVYLEHHDYHKYTQLLLCPTWLIISIRTYLF